jgi:hypothetical protein
MPKNEWFHRATAMILSRRSRLDAQQPAPNPVNNSLYIHEFAHQFFLECKNEHIGFEMK